MNTDKIIKWFLLTMWTIAVLAAGAGIGHRQQKKWDAAWYATQKETAVKDDGTLIIYGDNLPNSCEQKVGHMECSYKIYTRPAPAPPAKPASKRHKDKIVVHGDGDTFPGSCEQKEGYQECQYRIMCRDTKTGKVTKENECMKPIPQPQPDWFVKLAPCESGIYKMRGDMGVMECVPANPVPEKEPPVYDDLHMLVPKLRDELKLSREQAENPPLPTFTKEWVGHCPRGFDVYTCYEDGCKNTIPSPEPSDKRKYECYGWNGPIIGVN